ncbi:uncharacterized protein EAF02_007976 [Botrytis sinoallii]|uniref:uncharacterized protein n=1 Tax=Botrytis sinoallii TaxID=1463999 RepID=UPI00190155D8|nr:uncharacterized protein EAF02_007976 [Botrytis sinoallii]KAF7879806.1 hypothetical protein EAF02_007976 [Botrytis sinoallii]
MLILHSARGPRAIRTSTPPRYVAGMRNDKKTGGQGTGGRRGGREVDKRHADFGSELAYINGASVEMGFLGSNYAEYGEMDWIFGV